MAAALDKAQHLPILARWRVLRAAGFRRAGDKGFVRLNDLAGSAHLAGSATAVHREADAVHQEPRGFHAAAKGPLHLAGRDAFLRRANQVDRLKPYPQRNMARLKHGAHPNRERLAAWAAIPQTGPRRLAFGAGRFADQTAMRAYRTIGPKPRFDVCEGGVFVGEVRGVESGFHGGFLLSRKSRGCAVLCQA
jgi:hypothetical protein